MPANGSDREILKSLLKEALSKKESREQYPFVVIDKATGKIIGSTRFLRLNPEHRNLEIGYTWFLPEFWGKGYNEECKLLLLTYCFEVLKTVRVQLIAWDKNMRSRRAIERIGATFEGILRNHVIRNGEKRSVAYFGIVDEDWEKVKHNLIGMYRSKYLGITDQTHSVTNSGNSGIRQRISQIALVVDDYDTAINYYTSVLNFDLIENTMLSDTKRWVLVAPKGSDGFRLLLAKAVGEEQQSRIGNQTGGRVFLFLQTNNFERDYQNLLDHHVKIVREPVREKWGTVAVFADLYGNLWDLIGN